MMLMMREKGITKGIDLRLALLEEFLAVLHRDARIAWCSEAKSDTAPRRSGLHTSRGRSRREACRWSWLPGSNP